MHPIAKSEFDAYLQRSGEKAPFLNAKGEDTYDGNEFLEDGTTPNPNYDGEVTYEVQDNGDLLVECSVSKRFAKYPYTSGE